jgi:hypothetical protein
MNQPMLPPMMCDPEVLAYRSCAPVDGCAAARFAEALLRPVVDRDWGPRLPRKVGAERAEMQRYLFGEIWVDRRDSSLYGEVLWLLAQLGRLARDHHLEFEIRLGEMQGRVSTGGLDAGALQILRQAQDETKARPLPLRDRQHKGARRARAG